MSTGSEFGRGYATCLIQFMFHRARLGEQLESNERMRATHPSLFSRDSAVESWANGASDHLYELVRPKRGLTNIEWYNAKALADRALDIGHGFRPSSKSNPEEAYAILDRAAEMVAALGVTTLDEAVAWDKAHGLKPDTGSWSCSEDIQRRATAGGTPS